MEPIDVEFKLEKDDNPDEFEDILEESGAQVEPVAEAGFDPISGGIIVALLTISALANVVLKIRDRTKCGVIIDARASVIRTLKDCDLPSGSVHVFTRDGEEYKLNEPSPIEIEQLLGALP